MVRNPRHGRRSHHPGGAALAAAALAFLLVAPPAARADEYDTLNVDASRTLRYDSNLFRLSGAANAAALIGSSDRSEQITITSMGFRLNKPYSLQRLEFEADVTDYAYRKFGYLSFSALNYKAAWRWSLTPRLVGNLTRDRTQTLNSFADFRGFGLRNVNTVEYSRADYAYEIDGPWRLTGGVSYLDVANGQPIIQQADFKQTTTELGVRHDFRSGSQFSFTTKSGRGSFYKRPQAIVASLIDTGYSERQNEVRFLWSVSGKSSIDARLARIERRHDNFAQRDYAGTIGGVTAIWGVTAKTRVIASLATDLLSYQDLSSSFIRSTSLSIGPTWEISARAKLRLRYDYNLRDYLGGVVAVAANPRSDTLRSAFVGFDWQPLRVLTLSASLQNDRRASTLPGVDFVSTGALLAAQLSF